LTITLVDDTHAQIVTTTVTHTSVMRTSGREDWVFTWQTDASCDPREDAVVVTKTPRSAAACDALSQTYTPNTENVVHEYSRLPNGNYLHELTCEILPCMMGCKYSYNVISGVAGDHDISPDQIFSVTVCSGGVTPTD